MGFFGQIIMSKTRVIDDYSFINVEVTRMAIYLSQGLMTIFNTTKWIIWGSEYLTWYINDNGVPRIEIKAYFQKEYGTGEKEYYDQENRLLICVSRFGESLTVHLFDEEHSNAIISALLKLKKT